MRSQQDAIERLNSLGEELCAGDLTKRERGYLETEIFQIAMTIFGKVYLKNTRYSYLNGIEGFIIKDWRKFNASKGTLYQFMKVRLHNHATDQYRKESKYPDTVSLDAPAFEGGDGSTLDWIDTVQGKRDEYPGLKPSMTCERIAALAVRFPERLHGRANNPEKINYYRLFFTDGISNALRKGYLELDEAPPERELFDAIKPEFLDFFKLRVCRTAKEIRDSPLKLHGELVPGQPMKEAEQPLHNDVYLTYLNTREGKALKSDSTITNQWTAYRDFMRYITNED